MSLLLDAITFGVSFLLALALYPRFIAWLRRLKAGQVIQAELPESHQKKAGTPAGGGWLFVSLAILGGLLATRAGHTAAMPAVAGLLLFGALGASDDIRKLRVGSIGIPARAKFPVQVLLAIPVAWAAQAAGGDHQHLLPFQLGWVYWPLAVAAIVGAANAVNLTDGMDGLAGGLGLIALIGLALAIPGAGSGEKATALALAGGIAAFLVHNRFPAKVFMGDVGSLGVGACLAAMAIQQGYLVLLPLLGLVFVIETLSVIIQVAYFKASGGRRIFKMTPIHYTFHLEGWSENRIDVSFWGVGLAAALASTLVARAAS